MTRGPAPKENAVRRNVHPHAQELSDQAQPGRELPRSLGISSAGAKRFWKTWSTAPQTAEWAETDWAELEVTTKLVDALYQGELKLATEIRMRVAKWGATTEDRARLRMKIEPPEPAEGANKHDQDQEADLDEELYQLLNE